MIQVTVANNVERKKVIVTPETTLDAVIEESGIAMGSARPYLDGVPVVGETHKTLKEFGVGETAYLTAVANKDNN